MLANPFEMMRRMSEEMTQMFGPTEHDGKMVVRADLPGIDKHDVKVEVSDNAWVIEGERKREREEEREGIRRSERMYGSFYRAIPLPDGINPDQARAHFKNGVLEVTVPIPESQRKRTIPIEGGERKQPGSQEPSTQQRSKAI